MKITNTTKKNSFEILDIKGFHNLTIDDLKYQGFDEEFSGELLHQWKYLGMLTQSFGDYAVPLFYWLSANSDSCDYHNFDKITLDTVEQDLKSQFQGFYLSKGDFVKESLIKHIRLPNALPNYIDWESLANDMENVVDYLALPFLSIKLNGDSDKYCIFVGSNFAVNLDNWLYHGFEE